MAQERLNSHWWRCMQRYLSRDVKNYEWWIRNVEDTEYQGDRVKDKRNCRTLVWK